MLSLEDVTGAQTLLKHIVIRTPFVLSPSLSQLIQGEVFLKLENLQISHSFKARGAYVKLMALSEDEKKHGIIAVSAGNHAKAVSYHGMKLGISVTVVMPTTTPKNKIQACQDAGAEIIFHGNHLAESFEKGEEISKETGKPIIHPYDDPLVMLGQSTIGAEIIEDSESSLDALIIPIGGGGLCAGIAQVIQAKWPSCDIYGVQSEFAPDMATQLFDYHQKGPPPSQSIAEGIAVKKPGTLTTPLLKKLLRYIFVVDEKSILKAIYHLLMHEKQVVEGAGAAGISALFQHASLFKGKRVGIVICGGNIDRDLLKKALDYGKS